MTRLSEVVAAGASASGQRTRRWQVTGPDGRRFEVTAPIEASQDEVLAYAQQNQPTASRSLATGRPKAWADVVASPGYQQLGHEQREQARAQYFDDVVAPQISNPSEVSAARAQFDSQWGPKPFDSNGDNSQKVEVQMPDGTILEFPGDTHPEVMQRVAAEYHANSSGGDRAELEGLRRMAELEDKAARAPTSRYTEDELFVRLQKADAAGDTEAAYAIADEIRRLRGEPPSTRSRKLSEVTGAQGPWEKYAAAGEIDPAKVQWDQPINPAEVVWDAAPQRGRPNRAGRGPEAAKVQPPQGGFWRDQGLGLRSTLTGITDTLGIVTNPLMYGLSKATGTPYESFSDATGRALDKVGVPRPETAQERIYGDVGRGISGTGVTMGLGGLAGSGNSIAGAIGRGLTAQPGMQLVGATTGSAAAGITRENGGTEGEQMAAGILGALAPGGLRYTGAGGLRFLLRGGETGRQQVQANLDTFRRAGTTPTVSQATGGRGLAGLESLLGKTPGSAGRMVANGERQQTEIGARVESLAKSLSPRSTSTDAGRAIERGIQGDGGFLDTFKARSRLMYGEADKYVPSTARVPASATQAALTREASRVPGAANISELLSNPKLAAIRTALEDDLAANGGALPYEALKQVRSKVGEMIADNGLLSDIPTKALRRVYGALSEDMRSAIQRTGNPEAMRAFNRANNYYLVGTKRLEAIESVLNRNGGPEAIYGAALSGTKEGASRFRAVMQSLTPDNQRVVSAAMLRRLGRASSSQQDELGERFSLNTFLTNWNALSKEARNAAFGRYGPKFAADLDQIAKAAAISRRGANTYANPSGTGPVTLQVGTGLSLLMTMLQGQWGASTAIGGTIVSANLAARFLTNPARAAWLANATKLPAYALAQQAVVLERTADRDGDAEMKTFARQLQQAAHEEAQANQRRNYR